MTSLFICAAGPLGPPCLCLLEEPQRGGQESCLGPLCGQLTSVSIPPNQGTLYQKPQWGRSFPWDGHWKQSLGLMPLDNSVNPSGFCPHLLSPSPQSSNTPMCRSLASLPIPSLSSLEYCLWSGFRGIMGLGKLVQDKGLFVQIYSSYSKSLQTFDFNIQNMAF